MIYFFVIGWYEFQSLTLLQLLVIGLSGFNGFYLSPCDKFFFLFWPGQVVIRVTCLLSGRDLLVLLSEKTSA